MLDHEALAGEIMAKDPTWNWDDFLSGSKRAATYDGKMAGIPYRITTGIMHYQKALLEQAGITKLPETFDEFLKAAIATNKPPERYGFGISGRQGPAILTSFLPWLYLLRRRPAGLQDRRDLHQQRQGGRRAGVLGRPGHQGQGRAARGDDLGIRRDRRRRPDRPLRHGGDLRALRHADQRSEAVENRRQMGLGHGARARPPRIRAAPGSTAISSASRNTRKNRDWSLEFIQMACSKDWMQRSMIRGNAPPRGSVLRDPEMVELIGWPPVAAAAIETGFPTPAQPVWGTLQLSLRAGLSQAILGQKTAETGAGRRGSRLAARPAAGRRSAKDEAPRFCCSRGAALARCRRVVAGADRSRKNWCSSATTAPGTGAWSRRSRRHSKKKPASRSTSPCCRSTR